MSPICTCCQRLNDQRVPLAPVSIELTFERSENFTIQCTRKLGHRASSEARGSVAVLCDTSVFINKETGTRSIVSILERSEHVAGMPAGLPSLSHSERQGSCFLSYLFRLSDTIISISSGASMSPVFLALACSDGLQVRLYLRMLITFNSENSARNRPGAPCKL